MERKGLIQIEGQPVTLVGNVVQADDQAPSFSCVDASLKKVCLEDLESKPLVILSVPSVDTAVCSKEVKKFYQELQQKLNHIQVLVISMDLPFAQQRWMIGENIVGFKLLSDYQERDFGRKYGLLIKENLLLALSLIHI